MLEASCREAEDLRGQVVRHGDTVACLQQHLRAAEVSGCHYARVQRWRNGSGTHAGNPCRGCMSCCRRSAACRSRC